MSTFTNKLIHESSPYLLQHAHNPVNWFPWGEEALQKAIDEDKPILVSIGYAACHWCHVMERESFENEEIAKFMNDHFINIKIDREERPDLDHIYMDAVQAMTGSGGWPLNVFLTPDKKPFYGGTYFPPRRFHNRPSWMEVMQGVMNSFSEKRNEINTQAENLTQHLASSNSFGFQKNEADLNKEKIEEAIANLMSTADTTWGGFGKAPKFPQTYAIRLLLRHHWTTGNEGSLKQALLSLDKMIAGGIYDHLGGGFARYSTDTEWLVPHFEKMLYDNALLLSALSEAYQLTKIESYKTVIDETIAFIERSLFNEQKGFLAAMDADSEGVEGKYYVWEKDEVDKLLGDDADLFCTYYDITDTGNWEGNNILHTPIRFGQFCEANNIEPDDLKNSLTRSRSKLLDHRALRIPPLTDDKVILGWNALMNTALSQAWSALGDNRFLKLAIENMNFILNAFQNPNDNNSLLHTWKNGKARFPAFLDDYAFLIQALIYLQQSTGDVSWLEKAKDFTEVVIRSFSDEEEIYFYYTPAGQQDILVRKKEVYDGATPSGNAVMAENLLRLGIFFDENKWRERATQMISGLQSAIIKYPGSFGYWNNVLQEIVFGTDEIAILGADSNELALGLRKLFLPNKVLMFSTEPNELYPIMKDRFNENETLIYLCKNYSCERPVHSVAELNSLILTKNESN